MTVLSGEGDRMAGKRIVYVVRKVSEPGLVLKGGGHRGVQGVLYEAEAYVDIAVER